MNIIFVSNSMSKAKTLTVFQVGAIVLALILVPMIIVLLLIVPQEPSTQQGVKSLIPARLNFYFNNPQKHLDAYAVQLGEMQARMIRLDAQSERLTKLANDKAGDKKKVVHDNALDAAPLKPGQGGPLVLDAPLSEPDLQKRIAELMAQIDSKADYLSDLEAKLLQKSVLKDTLPNISPIAVSYNSSSFGWRLDPFNGHKAFHEGLDFPAAIGTPIYAAAGGVVTTAEQTPDYGKLVKIDHGYGLETRYAHTSLIVVKVGDRVEKGQKIAEVGSTGRSTGPHLHYEIRLDGNALDPRKYLSASN
ncbi:murein DD-endopeptidase MepM [mine drainage metagenome]|uniref:Murein DD-endopeptidase MepM n=1 Tax=mine drainage metagenome TaxID=410659 RepID=A0A1J5SFD4_9ZZZZ